MQIYFVRHGQTDWNKSLRWQGRSNIPLNKTGLDQAKRMGCYFIDNNIQPSAIVSSPLDRAYVTAQMIARRVDVGVTKETAFRELDLGDFEGKTTDELHTQYGDLFQNWLDSYHLEASPQGETITDAIARMEDVLLSHIEGAGDQLVIVAHQAILIAMKAALSGDLSLKTLASYKQANYEVDVWNNRDANIENRIDIRD